MRSACYRMIYSNYTLDFSLFWYRNNLKPTVNKIKDKNKRINRPVLS